MSTKKIVILAVLCICVAAELAYIIYSRALPKAQVQNTTAGVSEEASEEEVSLETEPPEQDLSDSQTYDLKRVDPDVFKIIMIDDDETNQRVAERFEKLGCEVDTEEFFEEQFVDEYDALIIPGGGNVTPSVYGEERSEFTSDTNLEKDETQIEAILTFADRGKPIFGICRGCQLLNVAFGGTLNQGNGVYHKGWHTVNINEDSLFYPYFGSSVDAYHYHKQRVGTLAEGFVVTQIADDDSEIIEAIEHESLPIYGLQWHCDAKKMKEDGETACQAFIDVLESTYQ